MSFGERGGYYPRPPEELGEQLERAQEKLGTQPEYALIPPSKNEMGGVLAMPLAEIKKNFARRYEMYLKLLRAQRRDDEGGSVLTDHDIEEMKKWLKGLNALDSYIAAHKSGEMEVLRDRQVPIFEDLRNFIEGGGKAGYVKLPTGVGKTVLFTELIEALDFKTLIVVPTTPLIEQTKERVEEFAPDLEVGQVYGYAKEHGRQVTIITYDSFVSQVREGKINPEEYDCLILDEAHTALSPQRSETIRQFPDALKLGFTATAEYSHEKKVSNILPTEIHRMTVREAVEEGLLCSFSAMVARTEVDLSKVSLTSTGEYKEEELAKAVNIASRNQSAVDLYKKMFAGETAVAYCVNIKHAEAVARLFNEQGIVAAVISGNTSRTEQRRIKEEFKAGKIKVLCNADILIPGFDEQRASVCLNLRPTRSRVIAEQRGGRVLRTYRRNPNKHAHIVDFIDQGVDDKRPPILFADVAEGAQFVPRAKGGREGGGGGGGKPPTPIVDIPGLEVVTDTEEVMRIVGKYREIKKREQSQFLLIHELRIQVHKARIRSSHEYSRVCSKHPGWPSAPERIYGSEWPGWEIFLREKILSLANLQEDVRRNNIQSFGQYLAEYKRHPEWPARPDKLYASQWPGWDEFLGTDDVLSLTDLKTIVRSMDIRSTEDYRLIAAQFSDWPTNPAWQYAGEWKGWSEFLGIEESKSGQKLPSRREGFLSLSGLQSAVLKEGIKLLQEYIAIQKHHPDWPSNPFSFYGKQWEGWPKFVGQNNRRGRKSSEELGKIPSFIDLQAIVRAMGIQSKRDYYVRQQDYPSWPRNPNASYRKQWPGWDKFLGKAKK